MPNRKPAALPYTGFIVPTAAGHTITWGSWTARSDTHTMPITLFPSSSGSDYSGSAVERSNHRVLLADEHVKRRSVEIVGGYGTYGIAYIGQPTRKIRELCASLDDYPLLDEDDHSELEMELETEAWDDHGRKDFRKALVSVLDELDADYEHEIPDDDVGIPPALAGWLDEHTIVQPDATWGQYLDMLWRFGCDALNVNGGSGFTVERGGGVYFYVKDWMAKAGADRRYPTNKPIHDRLRELAPLTCTEDK